MAKGWSYYRRFPTFGAILLIVGILWLMAELNLINMNIPWWPLILIIVAIGWIYNHYAKD